MQRQGQHKSVQHMFCQQNQPSTPHHRSGMKSHHNSPLLLVTAASPSNNRFLHNSLPELDDFGSSSTKELAALAKVHMGSAAALLKTMRMLLPDVFVNGSDVPVAAEFLKLEGHSLELAGRLVDLQMFHLLRASQLVAAAREQLGCCSKPSQPNTMGK